MLEAYRPRLSIDSLSVKRLFRIYHDFSRHKQTNISQGSRCTLQIKPSSSPSQQTEHRQQAHQQHLKVHPYILKWTISFTDLSPIGVRARIQRPQQFMHKRNVTRDISLLEEACSIALSHLCYRLVAHLRCVVRPPSTFERRGYPLPSSATSSPALPTHCSLPTRIQVKISLTNTTPQHVRCQTPNISYPLSAPHNIYIAHIKPQLRDPNGMLEPRHGCCSRLFRCCLRVLCGVGGGSGKGGDFGMGEGFWVV